MTDETTADPTIPVLVTEDIPPRPPAVDPLPVFGADGLPDHVKNGDASPTPEAPDEPTLDKEV